MLWSMYKPSPNGRFWCLMALDLLWFIELPTECVPHYSPWYYDRSHLPIVNRRSRSHGIHSMSFVPECRGNPIPSIAEISTISVVAAPLSDTHIGRLEPRYDRIQQKKFYSAPLATVAPLSTKQWIVQPTPCGIGLGHALRTWQRDQKGDCMWLHLLYTYTPT